MLLPVHKRTQQDLSKANKRTRPLPISIVKTKSKLPESPTLRGDLLKLAALDSLEPRCEGMKLNTRNQRSPSKRRGPNKVSRTDTLIRPILLTNFHLPRSSSTSFYKEGQLPQLRPFPENPEKHKGGREAKSISADQLLLLHEAKYVELKERIAFFLPSQRFAGLQAWEEGKSIPKTKGLLEPWGVCLLGSD
jgi:hypothetical protein